MPDFFREAQDLFEYTRELRRDFHRHPEMGFQEVRTAGIVARELNSLGLEVTTGIGKTGVVGLLEGDKPGAVILLRFDMDALPINEETGAEYASQNPGVMHACGHDGHTAAGLAVARLLRMHREELSGAVKLVFQPAEEGLGGAQGMIAEGILENPKPDRVLGMHLWNERPVGWLGISDGPVMAAAEIFQLRLAGKGGHGALPNLAIDPVVAAAQVINGLQTIASRNVSPLQSAVISITMVRAGETFNVIPATAELQGTIRTFEPEVRQQVLERFRQIVHGVGSALGCEVEIDLRSLTPAVINDPEIASQVRQTANHLLPQCPIEAAYRTMGSEDFAFVMQKIPGCFIFVGSANPERGLDASHHHPRFDFDEAALPNAVALMAASAYNFLSK
jgi:amidohydrolase